VRECHYTTHIILSCSASADHIIGVTFVSSIELLSNFAFWLCHSHMYTTCLSELNVKSMKVLCTQSSNAA